MRVPQTLAALMLSAALTGVSVSAAAADAAGELRALLGSWSELGADFRQLVVSGSDPSRVIAESCGRVYMKKPRSFLMHTTSPEESVLYSRPDGIYFYDPFVAQLNIYAAELAAASPFVLLYAPTAQLWEGYAVERRGGSFVLTPHEPREFSRLELTFEGRDIREVKVFMLDGNINTYTLSGVHGSLAADVFDCDIPEGTAINDER